MLDQPLLPCVVEARSWQMKAAIRGIFGLFLDEAKVEHQGLSGTLL